MIKNPNRETLKSIPPGLTAKEISVRTRIPYDTVRYHLRKLGYQRVNGQGKSNPHRRVDWEKVDWSMRDCEISRKYGITRQRVAQKRPRTERVAG